MHHHGDVAEQRLGACGGDRQRVEPTHRATSERIADVPEVAVLFLADYFKIRHRGAELGVPVDQALAAVDQAFAVEADERLRDDGRETGVHREALALPVAGRAEAPHLSGDAAARIRLPLPHALEEVLAADVVAAEALGLELALDNHLRGDAGVVGAGLPQHVGAAHALPAGERVHQRLVEAVPHVQCAGDVRRRQQNAEVVGLGGIFAGGEIATVFPARVPALLDLGGFETLGQGHGVSFRFGVLQSWCFRG